MADLGSAQLTDDERRAADEARGSLRVYMRAIWPIIEPRFPLIGGFFFDALCDHAQAFALRQIQNILIAIPPRFTKSSTWSIGLPSWLWTRDPRRRVLAASFPGGPGLEHAVRARTVISSLWYQRHFGELVRLRDDQNEKDYYETTAGGYRITTHVGGGTGKGGDLTVLDDPHNIEERHSETVRKAVIEWHDTVWFGRLDDLEHGGRAVIGQRIHTDDLIGHLAATGEYELLVLPQEYSKKRQITIEGGAKITPPKTSLGWQDPRRDEGALLCPERMGPGAVAAARKLLKGEFSAQQNQDPLPESGNLFKREWFGQFVDAVPTDAIRVRSWDAAATQDDGDYTAGVKMAWAKDGRVYVEHALRGQWGPGEGDREMLRQAKLDGPTCAQFEEQEPGSAGKKICNAHANDFTHAGLSYEYATAGTDKVTKARPFRGACENGDVWLVRGPWNQTFIDELCAFPKGSNDDQVDGAANGYNWLIEHQPEGELVVG
jgi:predicted phage terminase large subunit-like protein